ncbi:MAG: hypothetical protein O2890_01510 [Cyanobacteria bacterium]|nr:hypothetical protein [Cyanobacteriota bacterium]MDA0865097.1 hypothetical protein [Cyanobacteriota bacterium]
MGHSASRFIQRRFRKEPIISAVVTVGLMNGLLGTLQGQALLAVLGLIVVGGTLSWRTWYWYRRSTPVGDRPAMRYLPDQTSRPQMPVMGLSSKRQSSR